MYISRQVKSVNILCIFVYRVQLCLPVQLWLPVQLCHPVHLYVRHGSFSCYGSSWLMFEFVFVFGRTATGDSIVKVENENERRIQRREAFLFNPIVSNEEYAK